MADLENDIFSEICIAGQTVWESPQFKQLEKKEDEVGLEQVLQDLLAEPELANEEMLWLLKKLTYFYGRPDELLLKVPAERLMLNMGALLRVLYVFLDVQNPELDANIRRYMSVKLKQATWGMEPHTRKYLEKI